MSQFGAQAAQDANFMMQQQMQMMQQRNAMRNRMLGNQNSFWHPPHRGTDFHRNLPDQRVGGPWWNNGPFQPRGSRGFVIDQNHNGRYDRGRDGVLVFDMNRDGKYDHRDVNNTNTMMKAASGNFDLNGDGRVTGIERAIGRNYQNRFRQMDRNRDGKLDTWEMSSNGGKVWVDKSRGGGIGRNELHSPWNIPGRHPFEGSRRLDSVSPWFGSRTSSNAWWTRPQPGFPPCGCGHRPYY